MFLVIMARMFFPVTELYADTAYGFSFAPLEGVLFGQARETVYRNPEGSELLSELRWDLKPLFYFGLSLDFARENPYTDLGFFGSLKLKFGIHGNTGHMEDRDWNSPSHPELTIYSVHDTITDGAFWLDFDGGVSFPLNSVMAFRAGLTVSYMYFKWTARDGYQQRDPGTKYDPRTETYAITDYGPWNADLPKDPFYGPVIMYRQEWFTAGFKAALDFSLIKPLSGSLAFGLSPLIFCEATDDHLFRYLSFTDNVTGGLMLDGSGSFSLDFSGNKSISLLVSYRSIQKARGSTKETHTVIGDVHYRSGAGAAFTALDTSLMFRVSL